MTTKLLLNGAIIAGVPDPALAIWDEDPEPDRVHSGVAQSMAFVGVTYHFPPLSRTEYDALNDAVDALAGQITTSITSIDQNYSDADTWATFTPFDGRGMWPRRPVGHMEGHQVIGPSRVGGPIWYVGRVAPARV